MNSRAPWWIASTLFLVLVPAQAASSEQVLTLDPSSTRVDFLLEATAHDVRGTFALKGGEVRFDPASGVASGDITIDLTVARTGNGSRDKTMHREVLETPKFPTAVFRARKLLGTLEPSGTSKVTLQGVLTFHGADHPLSLPADVRRAGDRLTGQTEFDIPFVEWGLHDPSIFVLRVSKTVRVTVRTEGTVRPAGS